VPLSICRRAAGVELFIEELVIIVLVEEDDCEGFCGGDVIVFSVGRHSGSEGEV
jgi:hypothetical protein